MIVLISSETALAVLKYYKHSLTWRLLFFFFFNKEAAVIVNKSMNFVYLELFSVFKAIHGPSPPYISDLITVKPKSSYNLRSNSRSRSAMSMEQFAG